MTVNLKIDRSERTNGRRTEEKIIASIDLSDWHFYPEQEEDFNTATENLIRKVAAEAMRNVLTEFPPAIEFSAGGASIMVDINFGSNQNDGWIYFRASIEEMIDDLIERSHRDTMTGGDEAKTELANCLLRCASKLKEAADQP